MFDFNFDRMMRDESTVYGTKVSSEKVEPYMFFLIFLTFLSQTKDLRHTIERENLGK